MSSRYWAVNRVFQGAAPAMSRSWCPSPRRLVMMIAAFGLASLDSALAAQFGGPAAPGAIKLKEPVASRVYQRDVNGRAEIPIVPDGAEADIKLVDAFIGSPSTATAGVKLLHGKLGGGPDGGPYTITCRFKKGNAPGLSSMTVGP